MYDRDMPRIREHGLASPEGLTDVITFVLCTIQQPIETVADAMADVRREGEDSRFLWGWKRDGYRYADDHKEVLFAAVSKAIEVGDVVGGIDSLMAVPGLGIVKAAFVMQCLGANVGCIDSHNLKRLGLREDHFKTPKTLKPETTRKKIEAYVRLTQRRGARWWWNSWCDYVAGKRKTTGDAISHLHCEALSLT